MHLGDINCFRSAYKLKHLMRMMEIKWKKNKHILDMILLYFFVLIWSKIIFYRQIVYLDWWIFSNKLNIDCILQLCSLYNILTCLMVSVYLSVNITMILGGKWFLSHKRTLWRLQRLFFKWRRLLFSYNNTS